ncbi:S-adenosyl-L-methionine-dependent methyltransferase, partial [Diaporthe sp. PMI_573]
EQIQFIEIKSINAHNETDNVVIRGLPFARTRNLHGCLPRKWNEVCLILEVDVDDARPDEEQALLEIEPEQILRKRILTNTNQPFPDCRFDPFVYVTDEQKKHKAPLTCRWKMRAEYRDPSQRRAGRLQGQALEHLSERDSHKIKKRNLGIDQQRSRKWRGETIPGGSAIEAEPVKGEKEDSKPERIQKYSFAEVSAGAGGASRGAQLAGLKVVLATEPCPHACDSYRANFPNTELYQMATKELTADESQYAADFLHISSSALSAAGDDEEAVKEMCTDLLEKFHPRVLTMEQPATITSEQKAPFLNAILRSFTEAGYSIQWKPVHMVTYGLPQVRKRFIMIGAGPGEKLPSWPAPTHSLDPTGDQQRFITEEEAISGLNPRLHSLHNPDSMRVINRAARDADKPIDSAISTSGSAYPHPDGEREFTLRELACLQGFPTYHEFKGSYLKKQISTALPPSVAMAFYQHLRQHLEEVDGVHSSSPEPFELSGTSSTSNLPET